MPSQLQLSANSDRAATGYLDGLRGLAVASVVIYNLGHSMDKNWTWGGGFGTPLFCVITGYVLSLKPLRQIREQEWANLLSTITSHAFRRCLRIYLPAVVASLLAFVMLCLNKYDISSKSDVQKGSIRDFLTWSEQLWDLLQKDFALLFLLNWGATSPSYIPVLRTLKTMIRGPLVLFLTILGLSRCRREIRYLVGGLLMVSSYRNNQQGIMAMLGGMLLAEFHVSGEESKVKLKSEKDSVSWKASKGILDRFGLATSLVLLSMPSTCSAQSLPLCSLVSPERTELVHHLAAILLVWSIGNLPMLQNLFLNRVLQLLGSKSYSVYLVHSTVIGTLGDKITRRLLEDPVASNLLRYTLEMALVFGITGAVIFCAAIAFGRFIDMPVITLTRWLESRFSFTELLIPVLPIDHTRTEKVELRQPEAVEKLAAFETTSNSNMYSVPAAEQTKSLISGFLWFLVPSFIQEYISPPTKEKKLHPTAWLDGLRGYAALFVFWYHMMNPFHPHHLEGYGYNPSGSHWIQLPIIRLVYSGNVMVCSNSQLDPSMNLTLRYKELF